MSTGYLPVQGKEVAERYSIVRKDSGSLHCRQAWRAHSVSTLKGLPVNFSLTPFSEKSKPLNGKSVSPFFRSRCPKQKQLPYNLIRSQQ